MIAMISSGRMNRFASSEQTDHSVPIQHIASTLDKVSDSVEAGFVTKQMSNRNRLFAILSEVRPVIGYTVLVIEDPLVDENMQKTGQDTFTR